jgi:cytochrome c biogenesis protein ResB
LRIPDGEIARFGDINIQFNEVAALPSAVGVGVPGGDEPLLAQLVEDHRGERSLMLVGSDRPAISLAQGDPTVVDGYEYTFEGEREFAGISIKRDSGAWFIWIATGMLVVGLAVTFYVPRRRLWLKLTGSATLIAALAEKSGGFEKDMRTLADRIGVPVPPELEEER